LAKPGEGDTLKSNNNSHLTIYLSKRLGRSVGAEVLSGHFASEDEMVAAAVRAYLRHRPPDHLTAKSTGMGSIRAMHHDDEFLLSRQQHRRPHHNAEDYLDAYIAAAGIGEEKPPLLRSIDRRRRFTDRPMRRTDAWRMIKTLAFSAGNLPHLHQTASTAQMHLLFEHGLGLGAADRALWPTGVSALWFRLVCGRAGRAPVTD
jgi:hypothetical protein